MEDKEEKEQKKKRRSGEDRQDFSRATQHKQTRNERQARYEFIKVSQVGGGRGAAGHALVMNFRARKRRKNDCCMHFRIPEGSSPRDAYNPEKKEEQ